MKTFTIVLIACLVAVALAKGGKGKGKGKHPKPASCVGDRPERVKKTSAEKAEAKECIKAEFETLGVDLKAAKECLKECPREEKEKPDFGITKEQFKCFKTAAKPLKKACVESTGVELAEKPEREEDSEESGEDDSEEGGKGGRKGGKGGKGGKHGKKHGGPKVAKLVEKAASCGQTACVNSALGSWANNVQGAQDALEAAKVKCFGEKPEKPEPTGQCAADLATIKAALDGGCGLEDSLASAASTCGISDEAFAQLKAHHEERKANRAERQGNRNKRASDFLEELDL